MIRPQKKLVLENGMEFYGELFGADCRRVSEVVFNTSVVGYQEIVSDPSYAGQIVIMTYPLAGNYGITDEDFESKTACIDGLIVRECCDTPSNFRSTKTLEETLEEHGVPCISGVDTRTLTKAVRDSVEFYNGERPHSSLDWHTPDEAHGMSGEMKRHWHSWREDAIRNLQNVAML